MGKLNRIFVIPAALLMAVFLATNLLSEQVDTGTPSLKPSNLSSTTIGDPQSETCPQLRLGIQSLSSTLIGDLSPSSSGDPKFEKAEVVRRIKKLQMPFIANEGQTDAKVAFYANTFGGTVFVTKDGDIVYSLPMVAHASPLVHDEINKDKTGYTRLTGYRGKEGQCIVHRALCALFPFCTWYFPVYYSETYSPVCHSERSEASHLMDRNFNLVGAIHELPLHTNQNNRRSHYLNNSLPEPLGWSEGETQQAPRVETQCLASLMRSPSGISPLKRGTHPLPLSRGEYKSPLLGGDSGVGKSAIQNLSPT
ncbi:MAG: hypothetical protein NUV74_03335, partial [Candidatus Brocadiaceae bacterium]|nr:hypothetical protein [Candidatus Brocadiaceae bacterium]